MIYFQDYQDNIKFCKQNLLIVGKIAINAFYNGDIDDAEYVQNDFVHCLDDLKDATRGFNKDYFYTAYEVTKELTEYDEEGAAWLFDNLDINFEYRIK